MMQRALVTCEFLMAPGICDANEVDSQILNVVELSASLQELPSPPLLEDDAIDRLISMGAYPAEKFFRKSITGGDVTHSAKDVARIVNSIIQRAGTLETSLPPRLLTWQELTITPTITSSNKDRAASLAELVGHMAICQQRLELRLDLLHSRYPSTSTLPASYSIEGIIDCCVQDVDPSPSGSVNAEVRAFELFKTHLSHLDYMACFNASSTDEQIKFSIYCGALSKLRQKGIPLDKITLESINIGTNFVESLMVNQAGPGMGFSGAAVEAVACLIIGEPKYELSPFMQANGAVQRTHGRLKAFRTHVTKSGLALRLMSWKDENGNLTLANIGPKQELLILPP